jgi:hypothetical protein
MIAVNKVNRRFGMRREDSGGVTNRGCVIYMPWAPLYDGP